MTKHWFLLGWIRSILGTIDGVIYGFINTFYQLFAYISRMTLFSTEMFEKFSSRIYMILGIVMLFKIAFSLISYLANPDDLTDSKKGVGNIVMRIVVSLIVLTFVPTIFSTAFQIQTMIVEDNVLGNLILGGKDRSTEENQKVLASSGKTIAFDILSAFYYMEPVVKDYYCEEDSESSDLVCDYTKDPNWDEDGSDNYQNIMFANTESDESNALYRNINTYLVYMNREVGGDGNPYGHGYYGMHYSIVFSTIAGLVVVWIFLGFCFDVALRAVKLAALQLIAPIPILSYIDPKKGEDIFKKWISNCVSTYLNLFVRLIAIFFVIFVCAEISSSGIQIWGFDKNGVFTTNTLTDTGIFASLAKVFIYIGLFMFAKDAPKLIGDLFGIKLEGSFGMNIAKKGLAMTALGTAAAGTKFATGLYRRHLEKDQNREKMEEIKNKHKNDATQYENDPAYQKLVQSNSFLNGFKQTGRGMISGMWSGSRAGWKDGKVSGSNYKGSIKRANDIQNRRLGGVTLGREIKDTLDEFAGVQGKYGAAGHDKDLLKELGNKINDTASRENEYNRVYAEKFSQTAYDKYGLSQELANALDDAIRQNKLGETLESIKTQFKDNPTEYTKLEQFVSSGDLNDLDQRYGLVRHANELGENLKKEQGKIQDRMNKGKKKA